MKITLTQENGSDKIYQVKTDDPLTPEAVESVAEVQEIIQGKNFDIQGDMEDPQIFWITVSA